MVPPISLFQTASFKSHKYCGWLLCQKEGALLASQAKPHNGDLNLSPDLLDIYCMHFPGDVPSVTLYLSVK